MTGPASATASTPRTSGDTTVSPPSPPSSRRPLSPRRVAAAIAALSVGSFAIGTTEFVTMGLLPEMADSVHVSIPAAGHVISAYALGVVVGAPVIAVFGARLPRRALIVALMIAFAVANATSALAQDYLQLTTARFVSGLPHGAYFGIASLVGASLVPPERRGRAVSQVMLGLPMAMVLGVPLGTWMGQHLGWRLAYAAVAVVAIVTVALVLAIVPSTPGDPEATGRRELRAFREPQVWLTMLVGAVGFGGMFAMYSYIAPTVTEVTGEPRSMIPFFLLAFGIGAVIGTMLGGRLADWSVLRSLVASGAAMGVGLAVFAFTSAWLWPGMVTVFLISAFGGVLTINLQLRLMHVAGDAKTIGAALNHSSLNIANALGAWLGGLVIAAGWGYTSTAWVGVALSAGGLVLLAWSVLLHRRDVRA